MSRIPLPAVAELTAEQRAVYDQVVAGPRGRLVGPLRAVLHSPDLAARWSSLGEFLRYSTCLPRKLNELAILVTGRRWNSQVEFLVHAEAARDAGLDSAAIEAIRRGHLPAFSDAAEAEIYEFARQLQQTGTVAEAEYRAVEHRWGVRGVVELTALVGYYTMVSMTLNAHEIPLPDGREAPLQPVAGAGLTVLPASRPEPWECFEVGVEDFVAVVTMRRPPVNAQNRRFREEIIAIFDTLSDRADVRAVVLTGGGKIFSAGADLKERPGLAHEAGAYARHNRLVREAFNAVMECEKPVIAAINGAAIGAGCVLALCCDILVAAEDAFLAMTEVDVGLAGGVRHVRRLFGESDARLMIYTARRIPGAELLRMGVVSACVTQEALLPTALGIARAIAEKSPSAVRAAKNSFKVTEDLPLQSGYRFEQSQTVALASSEDTREAQRAFAEKRKPRFGP